MLKSKNIVFFVVCVFILNTNSFANDSFEKLKSLRGQWKTENSSAESFKITFEMIANESVLVETWYYDSKKHSLTLYHLDGEDVLATHYCPQGNQPRMRLTKGSSIDVMSFKYQDATNLVSINNSHQHALTFTFKNDKKINRSEVYMSKEGKDESSLNLIRILDKS